MKLNSNITARFDSTTMPLSDLRALVEITSTYEDNAEVSVNVSRADRRDPREHDTMNITIRNTNPA